MKSPNFEYLLDRLRALELLCPETLGPKLEAHRAKFETRLDVLQDANRRPRQANPGRPASTLFHFEFSDQPALEVTYDDVSNICGLAARTIRNRVYTSPNKAYAFYRRGHWHVLAKTKEDAIRELSAKFNESGNPDDTRELSPKGKF
jgi:hypothetical protein